MIKSCFFKAACNFKKEYKITINSGIWEGVMVNDRMERLDLLRREKRLCCRASEIHKIKELLEQYGFVVQKYSDQEVTQTIYLMDDEQFWTIGLSLKARRYLQEFSDEISLSELMNQRFNFEIKTEADDHEQKKKVKIFDLTLGEIVLKANVSFPGVRPYMIVEYRRQHFILKNSDECRITVDLPIRFWFLPREMEEAVCIKDIGDPMSIVRIEVKSGFEYTSESEIFLLKLGAMPVISKKYDGLNAIKHWLDNEHSGVMKKELSNYEIEAKYDLECADPNGFFSELKKFLSSTYPMALDQTYSFTMTTASVNHYWGRIVGSDLQEGLKILCKGAVMRPVLKSDLTVIEFNPFIIGRKESKEKRFFLGDKSIEKVVDNYSKSIGTLIPVGFLYRIRKAIWLENKTNGRIYHVSVDRCSASDKADMLQLEVEYSGRLVSKFSTGPQDAREAIISETGDITEKILEFCRSIGVKTSAGREKFKWLIAG